MDNKQKKVILVTGLIAFAVVFSPTAASAATDTSKTSGKTIPAVPPTTAKAVTPQAETVAKKAIANVSNALVGKEGTRTVGGKQVAEIERITMEEEIPTVKTMEIVKGEVTALGSDAIGLLYKRTETAEYEKRIPLDAKMKFINFKALKELALNDEIEIEYEKTVQYPKEPNEKRFMVAKSITLVKKYNPEEAPKES